MKHRMLILLAALLLLGCGEDAAVDQGADAGTDTSADAGTDGGEDTTPEGPRGLVYDPDPATKAEVSEVSLVPPTGEGGRLSNGHVEVFNCLNDPDGAPLYFGDRLAGMHCTEAQTALPDANGDYLIEPPADGLDPDDAFSEVQMYHHVNLIHEYYEDRLGVEELTFALPAVTNFQQFYNEEVVQEAGWQPTDNAAFYFPEAFEALGLEARPNGAIIFGQGSLVDFSYDASVIYHEYTHAVIGSDRLNGVFIASHGLDSYAGAINEGLADYFAASFLDASVVGPFGLAAFGESVARDLSEARRCPDDLFAEVHADGKIVGSAMWSLREALGAEVADLVIYRAMLSMSNESSFEAFGQATLAEASAINEEAGATAQGILEDAGLIGCDFSRPWGEFDAAQSEEQLPLTTPGLFQVGSAAFPDWAPGYMQFKVEVPAGQSVTLTWETGAGRGGVRDPLMVAVRRGEPVELAVIGESVQLLSDAVFEVPYATETPPTQVLTLSGDCLPEGGGPVHLLFLNPSRGPSQILKTELSLIDDVSGAVNVQTCE